MTSTVLPSRAASKLLGSDENVEVAGAKMLAGGEKSGAITASVVSGASGFDQARPKAKPVRKFGKPIDANRKRSLSSSKKKNQQKSVDCGGGGISVLKKLLLSSEQPLSGKASASKKRSAEDDDGESGEASKLAPPVKRHSPEKMMKKKKEKVTEGAKKGGQQKEKPSSSSTASALSSHIEVVRNPPTPSSAKEDEDELLDTSNLVIPSSAELAAMFPVEQQERWLCTPGAAAQDASYQLMLVHERMRALVETWAENDRLAVEIGQLRAEEALLDPLLEKVIAIKECLAEAEE